MRTSRPVANARVFSQSRSNGLAVAISRYESVMCSGMTWYFRADCSGTSSRACLSLWVRSASFSRNRVASPSSNCSSVAFPRETTVSQSVSLAPSWPRSSSSASLPINSSMVALSHSSLKRATEHLPGAIYHRPPEDKPAADGSQCEGPSQHGSEERPEGPVQVRQQRPLRPPRIDSHLEPDQLVQPLDAKPHNRPEPVARVPLGTVHGPVPPHPPY